MTRHARSNYFVHAPITLSAVVSSGGLVILTITTISRPTGDFLDLVAIFIVNIGCLTQQFRAMTIYRTEFHTHAFGT